MRRLSEFRPIGAIVALATTTAVLAGCGGASEHKDQAAGSGAKRAGAPHVSDPVPADGIVARVGNRAVTLASFNRRLTEELDTEPPSQRLSPPSFSACVTALRAATRARGGPQVRPSALVTQCRQRYQHVREQVIEHFISVAWLIEGARELGVDTTPEEAKRKLKFKELSPDARANLDAEAIRKTLTRGVKAMDSTAAEHFYRTHLDQFVKPEERDLAIVRTGTKAAGVVVHKELASGVPVQKIAKRFPLRQPLASNRGIVIGLTSNLYTEKKLVRAIFTAPVGEVRGPVATSIGYYVLVVRAIRRAKQRPLNEVAAQIEREVPEQLRQRALARFVKRWRAKWTSNTRCSAGFVVRKCRESAQSREARPGAAYALE